MTCPNCSAETKPGWCKKCGAKIPEVHGTLPRPGIVGPIFAGIVVAIVIGSGGGLALFGAIVAVGSNGAHRTGLACLPLYVPALFTAAVTIAVIALTIPAVRRRLHIRWDRSAVAFYVAFAITMFCPFLPCDIAFSWTPIVNGSCRF